MNGTSGQAAGHLAVLVYARGTYASVRQPGLSLGGRNALPALLKKEEVLVTLLRADVHGPCTTSACSNSSVSAMKKARRCSFIGGSNVDMPLLQALTS